MKELIYRGSGQKLSKFLPQAIDGIGYHYIQSLLRGKDIKINGKRVSQDALLSDGDAVTVYLDESKLYRPDITPYRTLKGFTVFIKPRGISSESFAALIAEKNPSSILCHRLDTNTEGLILFADGEKNFELMKQGFRDGCVHKRYLAVLNGVLKGEKRMKAYLQKDAEKGEVKIFDKEVPGSEEIITEVFPRSYEENRTLAEINLVTGKTHQIRAHLAHIGYPVAGDPKYGDYKENKSGKLKKQCLTAYKLSFSFQKGSPLFYLNDVNMEIVPDFIKSNPTKFDK